MLACAAAILILGIFPDYTVRYASVGTPTLTTTRAAAAPAPPRRATALQ
jgi:hypothetical protein